MAAYRILIADDNAVQLDKYAAELSRWSALQVACTATNGQDAWRLIEKMKPDAVLFDLVMPQLDGFTLLERISGMEKADRPATIVLTSFGRDDFVARAFELGAQEYLIKPVDMTVLAERILALCAERSGERLTNREKQPQIVKQPAPAKMNAPSEPDTVETEGDVTRYVTALLMQLCVPAHLTGYQYLLEAVVMAVQKPMVINRMTSEVYPGVAQACGSTPIRVERSIRNAIAVAWSRGGGAGYTRLMNPMSPIDLPKPANSELIAQLAARIRMKNKV